MDTAAVDKAFAELIGRRGVHKEIDVTSGIIRTWRYNLANDIAISPDTKLQVLQKSGWRPGAKQFTRADMIDFVKFYNRTSQAARDKGYEFVLEKWEAKQ